MEFEKFLEKVKNAVQAYFGENLRLTVSNVLKNNGVTLSGPALRQHGGHRRG